MEPINLLDFYNLYNTNKITEQIKLYLGIIHSKDYELGDLALLCKNLKSHTSHCHIFENYYINYKIPQIGKEFDILRIGKNDIVNIELKSQKIDLTKMTKQLQKNHYYLSFLRKTIHCFTFVSETRDVYCYDESSKKIEITKLDNIIKILDSFKDSEKNINDLFIPNNYLVSPFNNTESFLKNKYFLTQAQEKIKNEVLRNIQENKSKIFSIAGQAGTGKTLLTYDIAKSLMKEGYEITIIHCASSNDGILKLSQNKWDIIPIKEFQLEQGSSNILIFDETQRLGTEQVTEILKSNKTLIFAHDIKQKLNRQNEAEKVVNLIEEAAGQFHYNIGNKIRSNKQIASFIKKFFNLEKISSDAMSGNDYKDISFYYAENNEEAKYYVDYLIEQGWEYIYLTPSNFNNDELRKVQFLSTQSAHKVIGQEFNNVVVIITKDFCYNNNKLGYSDRSWYYNPIETLFQAITRTRNKLKFVIINNLEIYNACMQIIFVNKPRGN